MRVNSATTFSRYQKSRAFVQIHNQRDKLRHRIVLLWSLWKSEWKNKLAFIGDIVKPPTFVTANEKKIKAAARPSSYTRPSSSMRSYTYNLPRVICSHLSFTFANYAINRIVETLVDRASALSPPTTSRNSWKTILTIDYYTGYAGFSSLFVCFVRRMQRKTIFRIYI